MGPLILNNVRSASDGFGRRWSLEIADGSISKISEASYARDVEGVDLSGWVLFPGLIDLHTHGAVGVDVNTADAEGLLKVAAFLAQHGVTSWMPTLVPDSEESYLRVIGQIDQLMNMQPGMPVAQAVGVHYEGVFANKRMCGALRPEYFKSFHGNEVGELPRLKSGVHMMTLAPEVEGGIELVEELVRQGWIVSIGHTAASVDRLDAAFSAGARHMTHFFNAMTPVHHREVGVAGWGLATDGVTFDIIADGVHVHPEMVKMACRARSPENVSLISDSVAPTGLGDGEFELWGETVRVENGRTQNARGSIAGSVCTMLDCVHTIRSLGFDDVDVAKMSSTNPARLLGLDKMTGSIEVGKSADLVAIDQNGNIRMTVIKGVIV